MINKFIIHNPNTEDETAKMASVIFMSTNLPKAVEVVNRELLPKKELMKMCNTVE